MPSAWWGDKWEINWASKQQKELLLFFFERRPHWYYELRDSPFDTIAPRSCPLEGTKKCWVLPPWPWTYIPFHSVQIVSTRIQLKRSTCDRREVLANEVTSQFAAVWKLNCFLWFSKPDFMIFRWIASKAIICGLSFDFRIGNLLTLRKSGKSHSPSKTETVHFECHLTR